MNFNDTHRFSEKNSCIFCNDSFSNSNTLKEHLIQCGNRTDQCPNCKQFIRRAIFAYHYENNCIDLDESSDSNKAKPITMFNTIPCEFCEQNCRVEEYDQHWRNCVRNQNRGISRSFVGQYNDNDRSVVYIPCEFCDHPIESSQIIDHQRNCNRTRTTSEISNRHVQHNRHDQFQCIYCNRKFKDHQDHYIHKMTCSRKSSNHS